MIKYEERKKLDLFKKGNYIGSFDTMQEIWDFLETEIRKEMEWHSKRGTWVEDSVARLLNDRVYTFSESYHVNFFRNP